MNLPNLYGGENKNQINFVHGFCGSILCAHACGPALMLHSMITFVFLYLRKGGDLFYTRGRP